MNRDIFKILAVLALLIGLLSVKYFFFPSSTGEGPAPVDVVSPEQPDALEPPSTPVNTGEPIDLRPVEPEESLSSGQDSLKSQLDTELQKQSIFELIKRNFPDDYETTLASLADLVHQVGAEAQAKQIGFELTSRLRRENADALLTAPRADLKKTIQDNLVIYEHLLATEGPLPCARYAALGPAGYGPLDTTLTELTSSATLAVFETIEAGRNSGQTAWSPPTDNDYALLREELGNRGIDLDMLTAFENAVADDEGTCHTTITYFQILTDSEGAAYDRILAAAVHGLAAN